MSAYMVSDRTINALLSFARVHKVHNWIGLRKIGQQLLDENMRSVNYRYRDDEAAPKLKYDEAEPTPSPLQTLKLIHCLEYQSCETDDWETTTAHTLLAYLKDAAISKLDGYDDAAWGY